MPRSIALAAVGLLSACDGAGPAEVGPAGPGAGAPAMAGQGSGGDETLENTGGSTASAFALTGGIVVGRGPADVTIRAGRVESVGTASEGLERVDVTGQFLVPAVIDSHVHLQYYPVAPQLLARGVVAAVDLAAPLDALSTLVQPLSVISSGPMLTAVRGYPTQSWGSGGYGLEVATEAQAVTAVDDLFAAGASLIKVPFTAEPALPDAVVRAIVLRALQQGLPVVAHALSAADARRAAQAGVDVLAHTPVEPLDSDTLAAFSGKAVISTLSAFGGSAAAVANLGALREAGALVLYGTDLGNTRDAGIQAAELALLQQAGLTPLEVLAAATSAPAAHFGFSELGEIAPGKRASLLVLADDPTLDAAALAKPLRVYVDGERRD